MPVLPTGVGRLATRALFLMSSHLALSRTPADRVQYAAHSASTVTTLQSTWYDTADGLWNGTGWWNSANCLTTLAEFALLDTADAAAADLAGVFANTFTNAQKVAQTASKAVDAVGLITSSYARVVPSGNLTARDDAAGFPNFMNNFYDDEGWWALAWIRAYDVTGTLAYLQAAETLFADMQGGATPASCGGGIWWSKDKTYKNAIANELFLAVGAGLARRAHDTAARSTYRAAAAAQWAWFRDSGMISPATGLVSDGLAIRADGSCVSNNKTAWSYNQGVVVGGLAELHRAQVEHQVVNASTTEKVDDTLLPAAIGIATAAISALSADGILHESCEANNGTCGGDAPTFKGVFARNLYYLHRALVTNWTASGTAAATPDADQAAAAQAVQSFLLRNADSIWAADRDAASGELGLVWSGPPTAGGAPTAATHASAMDCLVAAIGVA